MLMGIMQTQRTRFKTSSFGVVNDKVANVGVSAKDLNGRIRADLANGIDHSAEGATADSRTRRIVAEDDKHVDWLREVDGILEPGLVDHSGGLGDAGDV